MSEEVQVAPEIIDEARQGGWVPKEEFHDDEAKWVDAETFVKRGREINPILRKNNARLMKELDKAKADAAEAIQAAKEFREFQKNAFESKKKELEGEIARLRDAKREAITQGDGDRVIAIEDAIDNLKEEKNSMVAPKEEVKPTVQQTDPDLDNWMDANPWYGQSDENSMRMSETANEIAAIIRRNNPTLSGKAFLNKLDERLAEHGIGKRAKPSSPVEGGTQQRPASSSSKKTYENLPAEAKAACDKFVKQKLMTREEYIAEYNWE